MVSSVNNIGNGFLLLWSCCTSTLGLRRFILSLSGSRCFFSLTFECKFFLRHRSLFLLRKGILECTQLGLISAEHTRRDCILIAGKLVAKRPGFGMNSIEVSRNGFSRSIFEWTLPIGHAWLEIIVGCIVIFINQVVVLFRKLLFLPLYNQSGLSSCLSCLFVLLEFFFKISFATCLLISGRLSTSRNHLNLLDHCILLT